MCPSRLKYRVVVAVLALAVPALAGNSAPADTGAEAVALTGALVLNDDNLDAWRRHIMPSADELRWQTIAWHRTFSEGLVAADARQMPLLLWVMNGHPLGCT